MFKQSRKIIKTNASIETHEGEIAFLLSLSSRRRSLVISVNERAQVFVAAPHWMQKNEINDFIRQKAGWIKRKLSEAEKYKSYLQEKIFDQDGEFLYLGKKYRIDLFVRNVKRVSVKFDGLRWLVFIPPGLSDKARQDLIKKKMTQWYRAQAQEVLGGRIFYYSRIMGVAPKKIAVRTQKRVWGNCDYNTQTIHLNWQIVLSPLDVVDYIVVHELCHLLVPDHSQRFWKKVEKILPDYKQQVQWLKINALEMALP